jgi:hypothetical protein
VGLRALTETLVIITCLARKCCRRSKDPKFRTRPGCPWGLGLVNAPTFTPFPPRIVLPPGTDGDSRGHGHKGRTPERVYRGNTTLEIMSLSPQPQTMGRFPANSFDHVPFRDVSITDETYWLPRINATYKTTLPAILDQLKATGRWDVFRLSWRPGEPNPPHIFWDR